MLLLQELSTHTPLTSHFPSITRVEMRNKDVSVAMDFPESMYDQRVTKVLLNPGMNQLTSECAYAANATVVNANRDTLHLSCGGLMAKIKWKKSPNMDWNRGDTVTLVLS